jgi:hypothetical protein
MNTINEMKGSSKNETNYNYCSVQCRTMIEDLREENQYLKLLINDLQKDKSYLLAVNEFQQQNFNKVIELIKGIYNHKESVIDGIYNKLN